MRLLVLPALIGVWEAAAALGGPPLVTAAFTVGGALLGLWALAALREG